MRAINHHLLVRFSVAVCLLLAAAGVAGGCSDATDQDKAGNEKRDKPVELVLANHDDSSEAVGEWAAAVERLSEGSIRIRISNNWRQGESNYEQATVGDVRRGKVALAAVAARAYDEMGVTSFQPLVAPMLIDSEELERRVLRDDVGRQALAGTEKLGLAGLALLPTELRRPVGLTRTLAGPDDYAGASLYTREGKAGKATFDALGARPLHLPKEEWFESVDGAEIGLSAIRHGPEEVRRDAAITSNVVLWPQPVTIVMQKHAFDDLSERQQTALRQAVDEVFETESRLVSSLASEDRDVLCRIGATFVEATPAQVTEVRAAVEPVYRMIERGAGNADAIASIRDLKGDAEPETIACPGNQNSAPEKTGGASPDLEGTYRTHFSEKELADSPELNDQGEVNDENWGDFSLKLSEGRVRLSQRNDRASSELSGRYTTDGDAIELQFEDIGETFAFRWSLYHGALKFQRDEELGVGPTPWLVKPWRRVR
jgi:TRAP-type C4-dicarboxylate transport system substrate-binding protein